LRGIQLFDVGNDDQVPWGQPLGRGDLAAIEPPQRPIIRRGPVVPLADRREGFAGLDGVSSWSDGHSTPFGARLRLGWRLARGRLGLPIRRFHRRIALVHGRGYNWLRLSRRGRGRVCVRELVRARGCGGTCPLIFGRFGCLRRKEPAEELPGSSSGRGGFLLLLSGRCCRWPRRGGDARRGSNGCRCQSKGWSGRGCRSRCTGNRSGRCHRRRRLV
jgi:hypothetical protein